MTSMTRPSVKSPAAGAVRSGAVTAVVCVALAAVVAAMSSLNVALPGIARATHASQTQLAWIIDAYSLVFAALLLPAGAFGDRYGRRLALLAGLSVFGTGSAVAMTARSAAELIALRAVLGLGAALVMPATLSTITGTFAAERRTRAVSTWAAVAGGAAILGLLTSGLVLQVWSWPAVFGLNVVLAAAAIAGALRFVPESAEPGAPRLDVSGAALAVLGLVALVYSIIQAPGAGWTSARTLAGLAGGLAVLAGFVAWELRRPQNRHPMLDPRVFARRPLAAGSLAVFVLFFALFGFIFIVLQYLQLVRGDSGLVSALSMLPMAAAMQPAARVAPALILIAGALVILAQLTAASGYWLLAAGLVPLGAGLGLAMPPATSGITSALPAAQQGVGSALNDLSREAGGAVGIAVLASVLTGTYAGHLHLAGLPAAQAAAARASVAVAARLGGPAAVQARIAFADGMHLALLVAAGITVAAAIAVTVLLRGHDTDTTRP